eukprot:948255-Pleurochrysis_carterae.AAC.1
MQHRRRCGRKNQQTLAKKMSQGSLRRDFVKHSETHDDSNQEKDVLLKRHPLPCWSSSWTWKLAKRGAFALDAFSLERDNQTKPIFAVWPK